MDTGDKRIGLAIDNTARPVIVSDECEAEHYLECIDIFGFRYHQELMERPFLALSKSRTRPIDYTSPDGLTTVKVTCDPEYGMATIWDGDVLIYLASLICDMKRRGINDIPRQITLRPYDILRAIKRPTGGKNYEQLTHGFDRLVATTVKTNVRGGEGRRESTFSFLDSWNHVVDSDEIAKGVTLVMSNWFYEAVLEQSKYLRLDPIYFTLKSGYERWIYQITRKHAGGHGERGWDFTFPTLHAKSGSVQPLSQFKRDIKKIIERNAIPGVKMSIIGRGKGEKLKLVFVGHGNPVQPMPANGGSVSSWKREGANVVELPPAPKLKTSDNHRSAEDDFIPAHEAQSLIARTTGLIAGRAGRGELTEDDVEWCRSHCPSMDVYACHEDFKVWVDKDPARIPAKWSAAFRGWMKKNYEQNHRFR